MEKIKAVIFDLDGTLASTNSLIFDSFNYISKKYSGKELSEKEIVSLFGPTEDGIIEEFYKDNADIVKREYYNYYSEHHDSAKLYPGLGKLLEFLKTNKILMFIYTGKGRKTTDITLSKLNVKRYFDLIITGDDINKRKSSGEGILVLLEKFNLKKENVLMIGDAVADVKAAKSTGVEIASVLWDSYAKDEVLQLGSDYFFHTVDELKEFVEKHL